MILLISQYLSASNADFVSIRDVFQIDFSLRQSVKELLHKKTMKYLEYPQLQAWLADCTHS